MKSTKSLKIFFYTFITVVTLSFLFSLLISKLYWGYYISRPDLFSELSEVNSINALIPIITESNEVGSRTVKYKNDFSIEKNIEYCQRDSYYCLYRRVLLYLEDLGHLPNSLSQSLDNFPNIYQLIQNTGFLTQPDQGYINSDLFRGLIVDATNESGERTVFFSIIGRELSNDHYPYYDILFIEDSETKTLKYIKGQKFYYDVAGIEGAEWYLIWLLLLIIGFIPGIIIANIFLYLKNEKNR